MSETPLSLEDAVLWLLKSRAVVDSTEGSTTIYWNAGREMAVSAGNVDTVQEFVTLVKTAMVLDDAMSVPPF